MALPKTSKRVFTFTIIIQTNNKNNELHMITFLWVFCYPDGRSGTFGNLRIWNKRMIWIKL